MRDFGTYSCGGSTLIDLIAVDGPLGVKKGAQPSPDQSVFAEGGDAKSRIPGVENCILRFKMLTISA